VSERKDHEKEALFSDAVGIVVRLGGSSNGSFPAATGWAIYAVQ
jgi:hypothetical protein